MKGSAKAVTVVLAVLLLAIGGILYVKQQLWKAQPPDAIPITQKESSPIDLRPAVIAKLQGLLLAASDSLYWLRIDSLITDLASGTIVLKGVGIHPDSEATKRLSIAQKLPDDVFEIELASLRISGISLADIMHRRDLHITALECIGPQIEAHHKLQAYNAGERAAAKRQTVFGRLQRQIDRLAIDSVSLIGGSFNDYSDGRRNAYKDVSLALRDVLLDSAAEHDQTRFLFAKKALLQAGASSMPSGKSGYDFSIEGIAISAEAKSLSIRNLSLKPHGGKEAFTRGLKRQAEVYDISVPQITLRGADWWALAHGERLLADEAIIAGAKIDIYVDQHVPPNGTTKRDNFPQQMLADCGTQVSLKRLELKEVSIVYEEFTKASDKRSSISFNDMNAVLSNVTNLKSEVAAMPSAHMHGSCRFMNATPMEGDFLFQLPRSKRGAFKASLKVGAMNPGIINPFAEAMGLLRITSGQFAGGSATVEGNDDNVYGVVSAPYTDLHIAPLKAKEDSHGRLKEMRVAETLMNGILVKNNNPEGGRALRETQFSLDRTTESNFFNFTWQGIKKGLLKMIGVPPRLGM